MKARYSNPERARVVRLLRKAAREHKARIWRRIAELLEKPRRRRIAVNLSRINRYTKPGEIAVVPGKTLGAGFLDHPVTVAAFSFSAKAKAKIEAAGGRCLSLEELASANPKGSNIKILG
ncbi:MAG: 50S ribosomal protein L18e [Candidatus Hecatellales archaeon]|nr:MAG: 50S ribosomal protein L18e [Candidatus Hecatellales archaeon]